MSTFKDDDLRNLLGHELHNLETHSTFHSTSKVAGVAVTLIILFATLLYTGLYRLDLVSLAPLDYVWNWLVWMIPYKILEILDTGSAANEVRPQTHAAKSEKMRRILGVDRPGGIMNTVAQASRRRLSSLPGIGLLQGGGSQPAGLGNWDNSCYQNSVLQGLASLDNFSDYLKDPRPEDARSTGAELKMSNSLEELIASLKDPLNNGKRIWTPAALKSMSSWQQQDAQEYFSKVLDEVDKEIAKAAREIKGHRGLENDLSSEGEKVIHSQQPLGLSSLRNPMEGLLAQRVGCTQCGHSEGLSMIPFNCLTVPLGRSWTYSLSACLDEYTKLEPIEGVECGKCTLLKNQRLLNVIADKLKDSPTDDKVRLSTTARLQAVNEALEDDDYEDKTLTKKCNIAAKNRVTTTKSRQAVIARPPRSLVVHVNRSMFDEMTGELRKNTAEVRFPRTLDLAPWCLGSSGSESTHQREEWLLDPAESMISGSKGDARMAGPIYELRAVVTHYGRHENGHYICYRKHPVVPSENAIEGEEEDEVTDEALDQWWRLSDDDVTRVNESTVEAQGGVFMLFYDCISPAVLRGPALDESSGIPNLDAQSSLPEETEDDETLSENDDSSIQESSATSVADVDDEGTYEPAKPIIVPPFLQSSQDTKGEGRRRQESASGSLIAV